MTHNKNQVDEFCDDLAKTHLEFHHMVLTIREYFLHCGSDICEYIKYGGIMFAKDGEDFGGIFVYKNHCSIEFGYGANLHDPDGFLEGGGKFRRHLKIRTKEDIHKKQAAIFIQNAYKAML